MSTPAYNWSESGYASGVIHRLQTQGFALKSCTTPPLTMRNKDVTWKIAGLGSATERSPNVENRPVMNAARTTVLATMKDFEANEYINPTDDNRMSVAEEQVIQKTAAMALGRRFDRIILQQMDADTPGATIGNGSAAISPIDIQTAVGNIFNEGVGSYEYFCALPVLWLQTLMTYKEFINADYVGDEYPLLKQLGARKWYNTTFIPLPFNATTPEKSFFSIPSANQAYAYLWVKEAIGFAANYDGLKARVDWVPEKKAWFAQNDMNGCAKVLLAEGVQRLHFATNVALSRSNI